MIDLSDHIERRKIVAMIEADVDAFCREHFKDDPRTHLGASVIGDPCQAKAWNSFRWLKQENFDGRMNRLFNRGHLEEPRIIAWLRGIGFDVREFADDGKQFRVNGVNGHFGGSLDAMAKAPDRYAIPEPMLCEFKTHNAKSFAKLQKEGVRISKPVHFAQMCSYGRAYGFHYGLYCAVNKDTDDLYFEIVPLDWNLADDLFRKADRVINSQVQPPKIAQVETYHGCKYCHFTPICHRGELPEKNCRSCVFAVPTEQGRWQCVNDDSGHGGEYLEGYRLKTGCDSWKAIINAA